MRLCVGHRAYQMPTVVLRGRRQLLGQLQLANPRMLLAPIIFAGGASAGWVAAWSP
jgi:hypothetical protein